MKFVNISKLVEQNVKKRFFSGHVTVNIAWQNLNAMHTLRKDT